MSKPKASPTKAPYRREIVIGMRPVADASSAVDKPALMPAPAPGPKVAVSDPEDLAEAVVTSSSLPKDTPPPAPPPADAETAKPKRRGRPPGTANGTSRKPRTRKAAPALPALPDRPALAVLLSLSVNDGEPKTYSVALASADLKRDLAAAITFVAEAAQRDL